MNAKFVLVIVGALLAPVAVAAGTSSGYFEIGGKKHEFGEVAAFRVRDQFAPRTKETYVMLTRTPVDRAAIAAAVDPYTAAINDPAAMQDDFLAFSIGADGVVGLNAHSGGTQYIDSSGTVMGEKGSLVATCAHNDATHVACTVKTAAPVSAMGGSAWSLDVAFDSEVLGRPPGKPMAKDGGAAGKAFLDLMGAVQGSDLSAILALLEPGQAAGYNEDWRTPEENLASAKEMLGMTLPKQPKITGGELLADDHAVLEVEGVPFGDSKMLYLVEMRQVGGKWVYDGSTSAGMLR